MGGWMDVCNYRWLEGRMDVGMDGWKDGSRKR